MRTRAAETWPSLSSKERRKVADVTNARLQRPRVFYRREQEAQPFMLRSRNGWTQNGVDAPRGADNGYFLSSLQRSPRVMLMVSNRDRSQKVTKHLAQPTARTAASTSLVR